MMHAVMHAVAYVTSQGFPFKCLPRFIMFPLSDSDDSDGDGVAVAVVKHRKISKQHDPNICMNSW